MDWKGCLKTRTAKEVKSDLNLIMSTREIAAIKVASANALPQELSIGKITLLYDALREYLEAVALMNHNKKHKFHSKYLCFLGCTKNRS